VYGFWARENYYFDFDNANEFGATRTKLSKDFIDITELSAGASPTGNKCRRITRRDIHKVYNATRSTAQSLPGKVNPNIPACASPEREKCPQG